MSNTGLRNLGAVVLFTLAMGSMPAKADLLTECNETAGSINKTTPQAIDKVTTLLNSVCFQDGRTVTLQYRNKLDVPPGSVDQGKINTLKPTMVNAWCTDPTQRKILKLVNIQYTYSDASGRFLGKVDIANRECRS